MMVLWSLQPGVCMSMTGTAFSKASASVQDAIDRAKPHHSLAPHLARVGMSVPRGLEPEAGGCRAQIRAGLALAQALGRALVLPQLWCGADRYWAPHKGTIPGAAFELPFRCPLDHVLDLEQYAAPCAASTTQCMLAASHRLDQNFSQSGPVKCKSRAHIAA